MNITRKIGRVAALSAGAALVAGSAFLGGSAAFAATIQVQLGSITGPEVTDPASPDYNYNEWHQGYDVAPAVTATVERDGLHIEGISQVIKGFDAPVPYANLAADLAGITVNSVEGNAFFQLPIFADPLTDGNFTTLRPADPTDLTGNWISSRPVGAVAADTPVSIAALSAAVGDYEALAVGVLTTGTEADVVRSFTAFGDTYQFAVPDVREEPAIAVLPETISNTDVADASAGFTVTGVGFAPNTAITISFREPDGTAFDFQSVGPITTDAVGAFTVEHVYFTSSTGVVPAGIFTVVVTDGTTTLEDTITVVDPNAPVTPVNPANPAAPSRPSLAATGIDNGPLFLSAGAGLLLAGAAALALTAAARRKNA